MATPVPTAPPMSQPLTHKLQRLNANMNTRRGKRIFAVVLLVAVTLGILLAVQGNKDATSRVAACAAFNTLAADGTMGSDDFITVKDYGDTGNDSELSLQMWTWARARVNSDPVTESQMYAQIKAACA